MIDSLYIPDNQPVPASAPAARTPHGAAVWPTTAALALFLMPGLAAATDAAVYELDPVHTRVMFAVEHAGFSKALGTVSGSTGVLVFDPQDWSSARIDVRVPLTRLDLGDAKWNAATLARNLLHGERYPEARFVSSMVLAVDETHAQVCGDLSLRGVTRPLCMAVTINAIKRHPMPPFRRTAGFSATTELSRADFGIDAWKNLIGDTVELRIEAEAVRTRRSAADAIGAPEALEPAPLPESATPESEFNEQAPEVELLFDDEIETGPDTRPSPSPADPPSGPPADPPADPPAPAPAAAQA